MHLFIGFCTWCLAVGQKRNVYGVLGPRVWQRADSVRTAVEVHRRFGGLVCGGGGRAWEGRGTVRVLCTIAELRGCDGGQQGDEVHHFGYDEVVLCFQCISICAFMPCP